MSKATERTKFYLFGWPISHSASPMLHNTVFEELGVPHRYELAEAKTVDDEQMLAHIRSPTFGGAAVTMPLKVTVVPLLDELSPAAKEIGSVNTIVVTENGKLLGENYDQAGIRNALVHALPSASQALPKPFGAGRSGFIIGGGGTTRAAIYALSQMAISPIYLVNRDPDETAAMIKAFPQYDVRELSRVEEWDEEKQKSVVVGVGAIPSFAPVTDGEKNVYAIADKVFGGSANSEGGGRYFLEMCYKPRRTPILEMAERHRWTTVQGIEAMCEQGFAQEEAWLLRSAASPYTKPAQGLDAALKEKVREVLRAMTDIVDTKAKL